MSLAERVDMVVIGAGPAGSVTAHQSATSGQSVLMLDKATFPRHKVCGCCLSHVGLAALRHCGLEEQVRSQSRVTLDRFQLHVRRDRMSVAIPQGLAISRAALDQTLIEAAVARGVVFHQGVTARVEAFDHRRQVRAVTWRDAAGQVRQVEAKTVVLAGGLGSLRALHGPEMAWHESKRSRIGCSTLVSELAYVERGSIDMISGRGGYVGFTRLEDDRVDVAAAFDPRFVQEQGGVGESVRSLMQGVKMPCSQSLVEATWRGTPRLTAGPDRVATPGLLLVGDAAGYVEPFTGEGMTWAILGGIGVAMAVCDVSRSAEAIAQQWTRNHDALLAKRKRKCRLITTLLRSERLTSWTVKLMNASHYARRAVVQASYQPPALTSPASSGALS